MRFTAAILGLLILPAMGRAQPLPTLNTFVRGQMAADVPALQGDKPFLLAVTLTPLPEWHIYWSNPGDAGIATTFKWQLPEGFRIEPLPMPLPTSYPQSGDMSVYGYTGKTTFLFRVIASGAAQTGSPATFSVTADYLVCNKDRCEPGQTTLKLQLHPAGAPGQEAAPVDKSLFAAARENLPAAEPPGQIAISSRPLKINQDQVATATVELAFQTAPAAVEAFPDADDGIAVTKVKVDHSKERATISLTAHRMPGQKVQSANLPLLIVYTEPGPGRDGQPRRRGFYVPVDLKALVDAPDPGK